jgi:hypothetical protein
MFQRNISPPFSGLKKEAEQETSMKAGGKLRYVPPKLQLTPNRVYGIISQKMVLFIFNIDQAIVAMLDMYLH